MRGQRQTKSDRALGWPRNREYGFALILTISLLTFLILLLVSLATLTKIEFEVDRNSQAFARARQNALLGLDVAIGQLQQYAGPDNRITSTSAIRDSDPDNPIAYRFWAGVWDSSSIGVEPDTWLVSGHNITGNPRDFPPYTALEEPDGENGNVWLLRNSVTYAPDRVVVRKVPIKSNRIPGYDEDTEITIGHYAYWVADEGVKSRIKSIRSYDGLDDDDQPIFRQDWDQQRRDRFRFESLLPISSPGTKSTWDEIGKVFSYHQLAFVDNVDRGDLRTRFHDVTVYARDLLTDTRSGGLRTDLSDPLSTEPLANWLKIRPSPTPSIDPSEPDFHSPVFSWRGPWGVPPELEPMEFVAPVVTEVELIIDFDLDYFPFLPEEFHPKAAVRADLRVELWNPYGAAIAAREANLDAVEDFSLELRYLPNFKIDYGDGNEFTIDTAYTVNGDESEHAEFSVHIADGFAIQPGNFYTLSESTGRLSAVESDGLEIPIKGNSTVQTVPRVDGDDNPMLVELWATAKLAEGDQVFSWQVWKVPTALDSSFAGKDRHHWKINFRLIDPFVTDGSEPYLDPRGFGLADRLDGFSGDPMLITSAMSDGYGSSEFNSASVTELFRSPSKIVLFDLPVRSVLSVGMLGNVVERRSITDNTPIHSIGNVHGGSESNVFDKYFFSDFDYGGIDDSSTAVDSDLGGARYFSFIPGANDKIPTKGQVKGHAAAHVWLRDGFNINSVDQAGWKSTLIGYSSEWLYGGGGLSTDLNRAFFRLPHTGSNPSLAFSSNPVPDANKWVQGVREIDEDQIDSLTEELVTQIQAKGPFGSLEDFVISGVIQEAIDSVPEINESDWPYFATARLTQADIMGNIAPVLTARSDTFLVRAYGDAENPVTGEMVSRAMCEAVVQRFPDYVDPSENDPWDVATGDNATFGRRFEIVYFRWLSPDDI